MQYLTIYIVISRLFFYYFPTEKDVTVTMDTTRNGITSITSEKLITFTV